MSNNIHKLTGLILLIVSVVIGCSGTAVKFPSPPSTDIKTVVDTLHGVVLEDDYRWLEEQYSAETRAWIETQNNYSKSIFDQIPKNEKIHQRLSSLFKIDKITRPSQKGNRFFYYKQNADQDLYIIYKREGLDGADEVLIDPHSLSDDHTISTGIIDISSDGKILVYSVRYGGQDEHEVKLFDVDSKTVIDDLLPKASYFNSVAITNDKKTLYYTKHDATIGPRVFSHIIGTDASNDKIIFGDGCGPEMFISISLPDTGDYLIISVYTGSAGKQVQVYYKNLKTDGKIESIVNDIIARFYPYAAGDYIFMKTDWEAPNGRIIKVDLNKPDKENWKEIIPESELVIENISPVGGKIFVNYLDSVKSKISVFDADGNFQNELSLPNIGTASGITGNWTGDLAFYSFNSFNTPEIIYQYNVQTGESKVWDKPNIIINSEDMVVKQIWFESKDKTRVPMFVVHQKELKLNGKNPTLMTGYGGFNTSQTPYFSSTWLTWIENGGVYVSVALRGGGEFGEEWHRAGMFENKQNTFDDFIAAAEWLIANKYCNSKTLGIRGGSNGGLLVGAVMTQRPDLFNAVICTYPLLDMIRYHNFMVAKFWMSEYGSSEDPEQFKYIYEYSPYHNVKKGTQYPATLFITGDGDTRVDPCHARKMTALLQANNTSDNPIMLRYEIKAGHSGGRPKSEIIDETAEELNFLFWQLKG